ncbi:hypothetical protein LU674_011295 [Pseudomonas alloputida]|uniref:Transmembrane anchored protein n=1 Tax=Pseudomonas alloputida TaxID=1940621 RepID=A0AAW7HG55_9PSED|nr:MULTISPECIES: hypothetical protein [Pseudomonas]MBI6912503.1 hypothetical protein [Pseudomonas juntendi]MDG9807159.1 hypothetical protein [Pseudomonas juntendi]MDM3952911.1 hypothetical protein [Pseudomonas alloputida]UJW20774.1 transmembrane anchored protein [Pseudomonas juntendi]
MKKLIAVMLLGMFASMAQAGNCDHSYDTAKDGSRCGGRSADSRPGG